MFGRSECAVFLILFHLSLAEVVLELGYPGLDELEELDIQDSAIKVYLRIERRWKITRMETVYNNLQHSIGFTKLIVGDHVLLSMADILKSIAIIHSRCSAKTLKSRRRICIVNMAWQDMEDK